MKVSASPKKSARFVPILISGPGETARAKLAAALAPRIDGVVETAPLAELVAAVKSFFVVGMVVLIPDPDQAESLDETLHGSVQALAAHDRALPVVIAADGLSPKAIAAAFRAGATDVLFLDDVELPRALTALIQRRASRAAGQLFEALPGMPRVIGSARSMRELATLIERVSPSDATVLILGESGTGKELAARAIHALSSRRRGPFVAINCAAIPETLLENELFGHEKGAYTGANSTAIGKVEAAEKGTLFLDEIGEMPLPLQSKILRLLQDHTYDRIGGTRTKKADVRIVTATNRDLKEDAAQKRFREDLYYRLSVVPITLPALRDRRDDIPLIAQAIVERLAANLGRPALRISADAMQRLVGYRWPGNVRELENELERAAVLAHTDEIGANDLELRSRVEDPERQAWSRLVDLNAPLDETAATAAEAVTRLRIAMALEDSGGDRAAAAASLGITEEQLEARK